MEDIFLLRNDKTVSVFCAASNIKMHSALYTASNINVHSALCAASNIKVHSALCAASNIKIRSALFTVNTEKYIQRSALLMMLKCMLGLLICILHFAEYTLLH